MRDVRRSFAGVARCLSVIWNARRRSHGRAAAALLVVAALALEFSSGCGSGMIRPPEPRPSGYLVAYVAGWEPQHDIPAEKLNAVNYAFAHIVDGRVALDQPDAEAGIARLVALK